VVRGGGEEKCLGMQVAGTDEKQLRAMIEGLGDRPLHAISIKRAHRISPVELRIRPPVQGGRAKSQETGAQEKPQRANQGIRARRFPVEKE